MNGKFIHVADDGTQTDVTEGVQALYDFATAVMDFGSMGWSFEDAVPIALLARTGGFERAEEAERYLREYQHRQESEAWRQGRTAKSLPVLAKNGAREIPHEHAWSSVGRCMWLWCYARQDVTVS